MNAFCIVYIYITYGKHRLIVILNAKRQHEASACGSEYQSLAAFYLAYVAIEECAAGVVE